MALRELLEPGFGAHSLGSCIGAASVSCCPFLDQEHTIREAKTKLTTRCCTRVQYSHLPYLYKLYGAQRTKSITA